MNFEKRGKPKSKESKGKEPGGKFKAKKQEHVADRNARVADILKNAIADFATRNNSGK